MTGSLYTMRIHNPTYTISEFKVYENLYASVCRFVCLRRCMDAWMYVCVDVCMRGCMYAWMYVCVDVCLRRCMYA